MKTVGYRALILDRGVKNLREFGYPQVTRENIITDLIYAAFFSKMLEENLGVSAAADVAIRKLLADIKAGAKK